MALFGSTRDVSALRFINRELMGNIITQQVAYYKFNLGQTRVNMYGENVEGKFLDYLVDEKGNYNYKMIYNNFEIKYGKF